MSTANAHDPLLLVDNDPPEEQTPPTSVNTVRINSFLGVSPTKFILYNYCFPKDVTLAPGNPLYVIAMVEPAIDPPLAFLAVGCPQLNWTPFCRSVACAMGSAILLQRDLYVAITMLWALSDSCYERSKSNG
jgi:hypothetical protein